MTLRQKDRCARENPVSVPHTSHVERSKIEPEPQRSITGA